jgi:hypothetical protein
MKNLNIFISLSFLSILIGVFLAISIFKTNIYNPYFYSSIFLSAIFILLSYDFIKKIHDKILFYIGFSVIIALSFTSIGLFYTNSKYFALFFIICIVSQIHEVFKKYFKIKTNLDNTHG